MYCPAPVAINKCDKPEAEVEACLEDLAQNGIVLEELGGDIIGVKISALQGLSADIHITQHSTDCIQLIFLFRNKC